MANWCNNELSIKGNKQAMNEFLTMLNFDPKTNFSMGKIYPIPAEISQTDSPADFRPVKQIQVNMKNGKTKMVDVDEYNRTKKEFNSYCTKLKEEYGDDNWYDWCVNNWGCKWDIEDLVIIVQNDEELRIKYETPWSPNCQFIEYLRSEFPDIYFDLKYYESGVGFSGQCTLSQNEYSDVEYPFIQVHFQFDENQNTWKFVDYEDGYDKFIVIVGLEWETVLLENGVTNQNVVNWGEVEEYFGIIHSNLEQHSYYKSVYSLAENE
jgi:hypothetical protein